jgi:hypothetical protein
MWTVGLLVIAATVLYAEGKKKSVLDYNDADVERIFREWEVRKKIISETAPRWPMHIIP